jgi:hypothetical protein
MFDNDPKVGDDYKKELAKKQKLDAFQRVEWIKFAAKLLQYAYYVSDSLTIGNITLYGQACMHEEATVYLKPGIFKKPICIARFDWWLQDPRLGSGGYHFEIMREHMHDYDFIIDELDNSSFGYKVSHSFEAAAQAFFAAMCVEVDAVLAKKMGHMEVNRICFNEPSITDDVEETELAEPDEYLDLVGDDKDDLI